MRVRDQVRSRGTAEQVHGLAHAVGCAILLSMSYVCPSKYLPTHPLATKNGKVSVSRMVLFDKIGPVGAPCHWCHDPLLWSGDLVADHLDSDPTNNDAGNLVPSCRGCNANRDDGTGHGRRDLTPKTCPQCGGAFVALRENHERQECCSRACSMSYKPRRPHAECGTSSAYKRGCRCNECRAANAARARRQRAHRSTP